MVATGVYFAISGSLPSADTQQHNDLKDSPVAKAAPDSLTDDQYSYYLESQASTAQPLLERVIADSNELTVRSLAKAMIEDRKTKEVSDNGALPSKTNVQDLIAKYITQPDLEHYGMLMEKAASANEPALSKIFLEVMKVSNLIDIQMAYKYMGEYPDGVLVKEANAILEERYKENTSILEIGKDLGYMSSH